MAIYYTDEKVASAVEKNMENFAKSITDSYFQTHEDVKTMNPTAYAQTYFTVFKATLQEIERQIESTKQQEALASMFKNH